MTKLVGTLLSIMDVLPKRREGGVRRKQLFPSVPSDRIILTKDTKILLYRKGEEVFLSYRHRKERSAGAAEKACKAD